MKRWITMCAAAMLAAPLAAQDVTSKSGGIIVKKVIKDGKIVSEDVEVFGDLDEDDAERYLKSLTESRDGKKQKKRSAKANRKKAGKRGKAAARNRITLRLGDEQIDLELPAQVEELLEGLQSRHGAHVRVRPPQLHWHGHGELDLDLEGLHERMQEALRGLGKHGMHFHFDRDHRVPGHTFRFAPGLRRYHLHRDHDGDHDVDVEIERDRRAPKARGSKDARDAARKIERLEDQIRSLRKELRSLKKRLSGSTVRTSDVVWL